MKQLSVSPLKAVAFSVAMAAASMANAATYDIGTIPAGTTFSDYIEVPRLGVFEDIFTFKLLGAGAADVTRTITYTIDDAFNQAVSGFNGLTRDLYSASTNTVVAWSSQDVMAQQYFYTGLTAGDYYFRVAGEGWRASDNIAIPTYNAAVNITAAPVPEPETYAMLLAGLGILGTVIRRRSNSV
jgi:hypothetical protein